LGLQAARLHHKIFQMTPQSNRIRAAADFLLKHLQTQTLCEALPAECRPLTRSEAYAIQALWEEQSARPLYGWKIAATSIAGQKHIGVEGPLAGRYIAERVVPSGQTVVFGNNHMRVAEVEFAFKLGEDLKPRTTRYSEEEVFAAIASLHSAIELPDSRYNHFEEVGAAQLIADNACAHWLVIGPAAPDIWRSMDLVAFKPTGRVSANPPVIGQGSNVLGSPRVAMTWLINELSSLGITANQGQIVTTGTCLVPMPVRAGDEVVGDFGELGQVSVTLN
jgi:2-keto-4-pentenoate hydratase